MGSESLFIPEVSYNDIMEPVVRMREVKVPVAAVHTQMSGSAERITVIRNMGLGDVIMSLVAVRALRKKHPKAHIRFACNREYVDIVSGAPFVDEVVPIDSLKPSYGERVIDLRMAVEPHEISGKITKEYYEHKNRIDIFLDSIGATGERQAPELYLREKDIQWALKAVKEMKVDGRHLIAIQPFCTSLYRSWPDGYFKRFVEKVDKERFSIIILGQKCPWKWADYEINDGSVINLLGKTTVGQVCALVGLVDALIGIDSGLIHVAGAFGVKTIALFGAIDPDLRLRYYPKTVAVTPALKLGCFPCGDIGLFQGDCGDFEKKKIVGGPCMSLIYPENVFAVMEFLFAEEKRCPICHGVTSILGPKKGYLLLRCSMCGFVFSDRWDGKEANRIYSSSEYWADGSYLERESEPNNETRVQRLERVAGELKGKKILDVGCGKGRFVKYLRGKGIDAYGIDWAVDHEQVYFIKGSILEMSGGYDMVTAIEVVEHVYDVNAMAETLSKILKPGGLLYIETSDTNRALCHKKLGLANAWFNPPIHCVSFDGKSLKLLLDLFGFDVIEDLSDRGGDFSLIFIARKR